jgi:antitoxin VapB
MVRPMPTTQDPKRTMTTRHAALFRNGRNQAVRIPRDLEMQGTQVLVHKEGDRLILTPVQPSQLLDLLASWAPLPTGLDQRVDPPPQTRDTL